MRSFSIIERSGQQIGPSDVGVEEGEAIGMGVAVGFTVTPQLAVASKVGAIFS